MDIKKKPKQKRDYGDSITQKTACYIVSGLTGTVALTDYGMLCTVSFDESRRAQVGIYASHVMGHRSGLRFDPNEVLVLRDALVEINGVVRCNTALVTRRDAYWLESHLDYFREVPVSEQAAWLMGAMADSLGLYGMTVRIENGADAPMLVFSHADADQ